MPTWTELERRFLELEPVLRSARLDGQRGTEGEYWRVAASFDPATTSRFESLATIAGRKLRETFDGQSLPEELRDAPNEQFRWYRAISRNLRFYSPGPVAYQLNNKGERTGWITTGSVNNPAAVSAAHCLELAAMAPEEDAPATPLTIHVSGENARLNVSSIDNSSNVINTTEMKVFDAARKAITEQIDSDVKDALLAHLDAMQKAVSTPTYAARYKEFMQIAADHVAVLGPVLAGLASFLS